MREKVFVGLGNPGQRYINTRHNFGFIVIETLAQQLGIPFKDNKALNTLVAKGQYNGCEMHLLMPYCYMNNSGKVVKNYLNYYRITTHQIVVVCDDIALELGELRLRAQGSSGGHNGLKSMIAELDTNEFARLRMGVGDDRNNMSLGDYVLSHFKSEESLLLNQAIKSGADTLKLLVTESITDVMNQMNK